MIKSMYHVIFGRKHELNGVNFASTCSFLPFWERVAFSWGGTPLSGHIRDVRPEWANFPGQKPAGGCKFFWQNLRMGVNSFGKTCGWVIIFYTILPGNGWFSSKLN